MPKGSYSKVRLDWNKIQDCWMGTGEVWVFKSGSKFMESNIEREKLDTYRSLQGYIERAKREAADAYRIAEEYRKNGWLNSKGELVRTKDNPFL